MSDQKSGGFDQHALQRIKKNYRSKELLLDVYGITEEEYKKALEFYIKQLKKDKQRDEHGQ